MKKSVSEYSSTHSVCFFITLEWKSSVKSFERSKILAHTVVGLFQKIDCFFLVIRVKFSSLILINEILPSDVAVRSFFSVLTNETDTQFRKFLQNFPKVDFEISL